MESCSSRRLPGSACITPVSHSSLLPHAGAPESCGPSESLAALDGPASLRHIRVVARIRPMSARELQRHCRPAVMVKDRVGENDSQLPQPSSPWHARSSNDSPHGSGMRDLSSSSSSSSFSESGAPLGFPAIVSTVSSTGQREFEMDAVFGPESTQQRVYENALPQMADLLFQGYNTTILAYGQTGSGKTFTMGGQKDARTLAGDESWSASSSSLDSTDSNEGIIPRAIRDIFKLKHQYEEKLHSVQVKLSCLEIYQDELRDLLAPVNTSGTATTPMKLHDLGDGVAVRGLVTRTVGSEDDVHALMEQATLRRTTASTRLNERSSRSHAVCTLSITVSPPKEQGSRQATVVTAKLTLVDLAGSERIKDTGVVGVQQQESININKDLFVLGKVVSALSERAKKGGSLGHVPYRDSKLTRLLRDALGGNCRTVLIACVSPADAHVDESINTLRYAERSRKISNIVKQNLITANLSPSEHVALRTENMKLRNMVAQLRKALLSAGCQNGHGMDGQLNGIHEKLRVAELEAQQTRQLSLSTLELFDGVRDQFDSPTESMEAKSSNVSPLLSYELSMGLADDDLESLLDESEFFGSDVSMRKVADALSGEVEALKEQKIALSSELSDLQEQVTARQSQLSELLKDIDAKEKRKRSDEGSVMAALRVAEIEPRDDELKTQKQQPSHFDLESAVESLREELRQSHLENVGLKRRNEELQQELIQMREHCKEETLKYEISELQRQIDKLQSTKALKALASPSTPHNVLQESSSENNMLNLSMSSVRALSKEPMKRVLLSSFEEEKKSEEPFLAPENSNLLQSLLENMSTNSDRKPFKDIEDESYAVSVRSQAEAIAGFDAKTHEVEQSIEIKEKVEELLGAAEQIFDHSDRGSVAASAVSSVGTFFIPCSDLNDPKQISDKVVISNIDAANHCTCEDSMFKGRTDHVEFYLPKLGIACSCGKGRPSSVVEGDPLSLSNVLRPWQCEFLASISIHGAEAFVKAFKQRGHEIAAEMRRWRRANGLLSVRTKSCVIALHIWYRTCRSVVRSVREQRARGIANPERPDFLQISVNHDARSVSTMGFGSVVAES